jgi:HSP20 family protein
MYKPALFNSDPFFSDFVSFFDVPKAIKRTNIVEEDNEYRIEIAVPGLTKEDINIDLEDSIITISHERKEEDDKFYFTQSFQKQYTLPKDVDQKKITAKIENGVLIATIPKDKKKVIQKAIEIM